MKKWYEGSKEPGVIQLCNLFRVDMAEYYVEADKYRNKENKATKKGHEHVVRPCGSKSLKKYDFFEWKRRYG